MFLTVHGEPAERTEADQAMVDGALDQARNEAEAYAADINYADRTDAAGRSSSGGSYVEIFQASSAGNDMELVDYRHELPVRGGKYLNVAGAGCTSGFLFRHPTSGAYRVSTAGHCASGGDFVGETGGTVRMINTSYVGTIRTNRLEDGGTDVALFSVPSTSTSAADTWW